MNPQNNRGFLFFLVEGSSSPLSPSVLVQRHGATAAAAATTIAALLSGGLVAATFVFSTKRAAAADNNHQAANSRPAYQIETDFMDRMAHKPYMRASNIPKRLRIMAVDVPPMRQAFDGECRINLSKVYADGIAPAKVITQDEEDNDHHDMQNSDKGNARKKKKVPPKIQVTQKSFAKSLIKCRKEKKIGVELLEASVADLNPHNMRRTHQFGSYRFDPGKYTKGGGGSGDSEEEGGRQKVDDDDERSHHHHHHHHHVESIEKENERGETVLATPDDEMEAPWHQYAWMEELELRIEGKVAFGGQLNPANRLERLWNGNVYRSTIPSARSWWEWFLPPLFHRDPAGIDGSGDGVNLRGGSGSSSKTSATTGGVHPRNWASNKPHAVIADGTALQRVPGSMRFLQRTCEENNVPLFVVNDPRVWGGNTHQDLSEALLDLRKSVKQQLVEQSMGQRSAFLRGRLVGNMETELMWQAREAGRKTREAVQAMNRRLREERDSDWGELDGKELAEKLSKHKVVTLGRGSRKDKRVPILEYSPGMVDLAKQWMEANGLGTKKSADVIEPNQLEASPPSESSPPSVEGSAMMLTVNGSGSNGKETAMDPTLTAGEEGSSGESKAVETTAETSNAS